MHNPIIVAVVCTFIAVLAFVVVNSLFIALMDYLFPPDDPCDDWSDRPVGGGR